MPFCVSFPAAKDPGNKDSDCFAVFLLSHGSDSGKVYGTDQEILISKLIEPLKQNKYLAGKPKMVFVQVCCGSFDSARLNTVRI